MVREGEEGLLSRGVEALVGIALRFTAGRFHATPWGRHVNEGVVEWPPSPWRLLRALVAVWRRTLPDVDQASVEELLARLSSPPEFFLPQARTAHTRHYMPLGAPKSTALVFDTFVALSPHEPVVCVWPAVDLSPDQEELLRQLLDILPYLGRAESWVRASLVDQVPPVNCRPVARDAPDPSVELVRVLAPAEPFSLAALIAETGSLRSLGYLSPPGSRWVTYALPEGALEGPRRSRRPRTRGAQHPEVTLVRFALDGPVLPRVVDTLRVGEVARQAAMSQYGRRHDGRVSSTFSGRAEDGTPLQGHRHAFYIPTDEDGDGRLDHLTIWAPGGLQPDELEALAAVEELARGRESLRLSVIWLGAGRPEDFPIPWLGWHRRWRSQTPFVLSRHVKLRGDTQGGTVPKQLVDGPEDQLRLELRRRGYPTPVSVRRLPALPLGSGAGPTRSSRAYRWYEFHRWRSRVPPAGGAYGFEMEFEEEVPGPLLLGYACHFGLGLFVPSE